jgi:hypothetical protein
MSLKKQVCIVHIFLDMGEINNGVSNNGVRLAKFGFVI